MTSCMKGAAVKWSNCESEILREFNEDIDEIGSRREYSGCHKHYSEGSMKCGFPMWATITLVVIGVIILTTTTCLVLNFCHRRSLL